MLVYDTYARVYIVILILWYYGSDAVLFLYLAAMLFPTFVLSQSSYFDFSALSTFCTVSILTVNSILLDLIF
jgi:hypothetical protein